MGVLKAAVGDTVMTFIWVFITSMFGLFTHLIVTALGIQKLVWAPLVVLTLLIFVSVFLFDLIAGALGGASFNPTGNAAFYAAGIGGDSLFSMALRFPAQAVGAVGGVLAVTEVMPPQYKHMLVGPTLKVDLQTGAIAEGILTFLITFAVLLILLKGPRNTVFQTWLIAVATILVIVAGAEYTGPSMNPVNAFGWACVNNWHNTWEQFYVYWICPFIGAVFAAILFRVIFPPPKSKPKQKKA